MWLGKSFTNSEKSIGPSIEPCGIPKLMLDSSDVSPFNLVTCFFLSGMRWTTWHCHHRTPVDAICPLGFRDEQCQMLSLNPGRALLYISKNMINWNRIEIEIELQMQHKHIEIELPFPWRIPIAVWLRSTHIEITSRMYNILHYLISLIVNLYFVFLWSYFNCHDVTCQQMKTHWKSFSTDFSTSSMDIGLISISITTTLQITLE